MVLPKLLCIGAQKAGTSWLHENLAHNTDIWVPPFKELHFFDHKFVAANRRWTRWHVHKSVKEARLRLEKAGTTTSEQFAYLDGLLEPQILNGTWYKRVFSACPAGRIGLDVTPEYASLPNDGIEFLKKFLGPDVRIIYIVRAPVERALSQLAMNLARQKKVPMNRSEWLSAADDEAIVDRGNYRMHIPRWDALIPKDQMLYLPFGMIATDPVGFLRLVESFAGLSTGNYPHAGRIVFKGREIAFPQFVRDHLERKFLDQVKFLDQRFGYEFTATTT